MGYRKRMLGVIIGTWILLYLLFPWKATQELPLDILVPATLTAGAVIGTLLYLLQNILGQRQKGAGFYLGTLCLILGLSTFANAYVFITGATDNPLAVSTVATLLSSFLGIAMGGYRRKLAPWIADYRNLNLALVKNGGAGLICLAAAASVCIVVIDEDLVALWATGAIGFSVGSLGEFIS